MELARLTAKDFAALLHSSFHVTTSSGEAIEAELVKVDEFSGGGRPFSVVFRGPRSPVLEQRIYRVEHPEMGAAEIFLVPVGVSDEGMDYEAVFN